VKTVLDFTRSYREGVPITMVTGYDTWSAKLIAESRIDCILVGDSAAMVMHGEESTLGATVEMMETHVRAVRCGAPGKFLVADMPFMSFRKGPAPALETVERLCRAGAQAVKLEGADGHLDVVSRIVESGIPVMGHIGLTPQFIHQMGGHRVQGRSEAASAKLREQAEALEAAGCFSIVLECIPEKVARDITGALDIPTIGIGSGPGTSGQVLVFQDLLGMTRGFNPVFVRKYLDGAELIGDALDQYVRDVSEKAYPSLDESYFS